MCGVSDLGIGAVVRSPAQGPAYRVYCVAHCSENPRTRRDDCRKNNKGGYVIRRVEHDCPKLRISKAASHIKGPSLVGISGESVNHNVVSAAKESLLRRRHQYSRHCLIPSVAVRDRVSGSQEGHFGGEAKSKTKTPEIAPRRKD